MALLQMILLLALIGFVVYLIVTYIPMPEIFKQVLMVIVAIVLIYWVASILLGGPGIGGPGALDFPRIR
jgi:hypothetical protein